MIHTDEQQAILHHSRTTSDSFIIDARAGTGKTFTLIEILKVLPQASALVLAFNKRIADEMSRRMPKIPRTRVAHVKTLHAAGYWILRHRFPHVKISREITEHRIREASGGGVALRVLGAATRLLRLVKDFQHASELDHDFAFHLGTDFGVFDKLENGHEISNAVEIVGKAYAASQDVGDEIDFPDQGWLPLVLDLEPPSRYRAVLLDEAQDVNANQVAMVERLLAPGGRIIAAGDLNQCHPASTLIEMTGGERISVDQIKSGMYVVSYHDEFRGLASQGRRVLEVNARDYDGDMITIRAGDEIVHVTPNHRIPTRFVNDEKPRWALYLMEYGKTSRLGCCQLRYAHAFGPSMRARHEGADRLWVLKVFEDGDDALIEETLTSIRFGIPEHIFKEKEAYKQRLISAIGDNSSCARACLAHFGRDYSFPIYTKGEGKHVARVYSYITEACNLIEGLNEVRTFNGTKNGGAWIPISLSRYHFLGKVYSLSVEPTEGGLRLYVADRILVHNSIYEWRGAQGDSTWDCLREQHKASSFPLTITWRCDREIVREANRLVPELRARADAELGGVHTIDEDELGKAVTHFEGSTFVLSRTNAELLRIALEMWKQSISFNMAQSPEVLQPLKGVLAKILKNLLPPTAVMFQQSLAAWRLTEMMKAQTANSSSWADRIEEQYKMLLFCSNYAEPRGIEGLIDNIYSHDETCEITLSTVHKAKGLEADNVFLLRETFQRYQNRVDRDGNAIPVPQEEDNIEYVAITRARHMLTWVCLKRES